MIPDSDFDFISDMELKIYGINVTTASFEDSQELDYLEAMERAAVIDTFQQLTGEE